MSAGADEMQLGCTLSDPDTQVGPGQWKYIGQFVVGFGSEAALVLGLGGESFSLELSKGVDHPQSELSFKMPLSSPCRGQGSRLLSGVSFRGHASGSKVSRSVVTCPTDASTGWEWPWAAGSRCVQWRVTSTAAEFFIKPPDGHVLNSNNENGWLRYDDASILMQQLQPPFDMYCEVGGAGVASLACAVRFPNKVIADGTLTMKMSCHIEG
eukprot:560125-Prymnesium_polylepis.1